MKRLLSIFLTVPLLFSNVFADDAMLLVSAEEEETAEISDETAMEEEDAPEADEPALSEDTVTAGQEENPETENPEEAELTEDPAEPGDVQIPEEIFEEEQPAEEEKPGDIPAEEVPAEEDEEEYTFMAAAGAEAGSAYAILTASGDLVFFRSEEDLTDGAYLTVTIGGTSYTGTIFVGFETVTTYSGFIGNTNIRNIFVAEDYVIRPKSLTSWFSGCSELLTADLHGFDFGYGGSIYKLFSGCSKLESADLTVKNTLSITDLKEVFLGCSSLHEVVMLPSTANVKNFTGLFSGCESLETLDLSGVSTAKATTMLNMFQDCSSLQTVMLGTEFTKWLSDAYLPAGRWTNTAAGLVKTEQELYSQYPANAATWAGTWTRDMEGTAYAVLKADGDFVFTRSYYSYENGQYAELIDRSGNVYAGTVFSDVENTPYSYSMPWETQRNLIKHVYAVDEIRPANMYNWFYGCSNLESFSGTNFNTSETKSMIQLFCNCGNLTSVDVSAFVTSNTESMAGMFRSCEKLTSIDLSGFDTSNVTNMEQMFYMCRKLTNLRIGSFDTSKVTLMASMFSRCGSLTSLDLSHFNTANVEYMYDMFEDCHSLTSLSLTSFDTSKVKNFRGMFSGSENLQYLDLSSFDTSAAETMENMFADCGSLNEVVLGTGWTKWIDGARLPEGTWTNSGIGLEKTESELYSEYPSHAAEWAGSWRKSPAAYAVLKDDGDFVFVRSYQNYESGVYGTLTDIRDETITGRIFTNVENSGSSPSWTGYTDEILNVYARDEIQPLTMERWFANASNLNNFQTYNIDFSEVRSTYEMFYRCTSLTSVDFTDADLGNSESMSWMFNDCENLLYVYFDGADISAAEYMRGLFYDCYELIEISGIGGLENSVVKDMAYMFSSCNKLASIDLGRFDTSGVTDMSGMFYGCGNLSSLNISGFTTPKVTDMGAMFYECGSLTSLDLSGFDTSAVTYMRSMFSGCVSLTSLDISGFNTANVTDMEFLFSDCKALTSLDLSGFNTSSTTKMMKMFAGCSSLKELDLSAFNTSGVTSMWGMFEDMSALSSVKLGSGWTVWHDDARLPEGTWVNGSGKLHKTAEELQTEYPANAKKWAGIWKRDFAYAVLTGAGDLIFFRSPESYEQGTTGTFTDGKGNLYSGTVYGNVERENYYPGWHGSSEIKRVYANDTIRPKTMESWFDSCGELRSFNAENFDTSDVTSMYWMFRYCSSLEEIDLHTFNTSKVTTMNCMFAGDNGLKQINLNGFDTSQVTDMAWMFDYTYHLETLDLSSFDTSNVTNMYRLFNSTGLKEIRLGPKWIMWTDDEGSVLPDHGTWENEKLNLILTAEDLRNQYPANAASWAGTWKIRLAYAVLDSAGNLVFVRSDQKYTNGSYGTAESLSGASYTGTIFSGVECCKGSYPDLTPWYQGYRTDIRHVYAADVIKPLTMNYWFDDCANLESFDAERFDTSHCTDMGSLFDNCYKLTSLDLRGFDTSSVTSMHSMFSGCEQLESVVLTGFDTGNVTEFTYMFYDCKKLKDLNLASFDTSRAEQMYCMFTGCESLTELDLSNFSTGNLESGFIGMNYMFEGCKSLKTLDLSSFDTSGITEMESLFAYCDSLESLNLSSFDTSNVVSMYDMFNGCANLNEIILGEGWTRWTDSAILPSGTWTNGVLYLDETALYNEYPVHVAEWQGVWTLTDPFGEIVPMDRPGSVSDIPEGLWMSYLAPEFYTGKAIKKDFRVYDHRRLLQAGKDYTVKYSNNTNAGTASVTVTGKGVYQGTLKGTFVIEPLEITAINSRITLDKDYYAYSAGKTQKPKVLSVEREGKKLSSRTDYTVSLLDSTMHEITKPVASGDYYVRITGKGNYEGYANVPFHITDLVPVNTLKISGIRNYSWNNGAPVYQTSLKITDAGKRDSDHDGVLVPGTDCYLSYTNNIDAGTATLMIEGDGVTYAGRVYKTFKITGTPVSKLKILYFEKTKQYVGYPVAQGITVKDPEGNDLTIDTDYTIGYLNNTEVGTATMILTGMGGYTGTLKKTFKITGDPFNAKTINVAGFVSTMTFTGEPLVQTGLILQENMFGTTLVEGVHYSVSYKNNVKAGTASMTLKGLGGFSGSFTKTFRIAKAAITTDDVVMPESHMYTKGGVKPVPKVTVNGRILKLNTDFTLSFSNNSKPGTAAVTVKGKGNYSGTVKKTFIITGSDETRLTMTAADKVFANKASAMKTAITVTDINGKKLTAGTDYNKAAEYSYVAHTVLPDGTERNPGDPVLKTDIVPAGTELRASITLKGNYSGTMSQVFRIVEKDISKAAVSIVTQFYTGMAVIPSDEDITVRFGSGTPLVYGSDYEIVSCRNNVKTGKASVTLRGIGNYGGTKTVSFTIAKRSMGIVVVFRPNGAVSGTMKPVMIYKNTKLPANKFRKPGKTFHDMGCWNTRSDYTGTWYKDGELFPYSEAQAGSIVILYSAWKE